ncbi:MAG: phosphocholine cytidylyltransferase family protein [bacterium]|nr:phosphocholine cytidylyltransferase family protein [bacterium]
MRVMILAAGRGTRISRYLSGNPKCTVDIGGGKKLIQYTVETLLKKGVSQIAIALGYRADVIRDVLKEYPGIQYYENPFFDVTNSIASAWFAQEFLKPCEDTVIMNGDVYLEERLMDYILKYGTESACTAKDGAVRSFCWDRKSPVMFADGSRKKEADYKFLYEDGILKKYGKELEEWETSGEYIGIGYFSGDFIRWFIEEMNRKIRKQEHSVWWENVVYGLVGKEPVFVEEIHGMFWAEVDYIEDYDRILEFRGYADRRVVR